MRSHSAVHLTLVIIVFIGEIITVVKEYQELWSAILFSVLFFIWYFIISHPKSIYMDFVNISDCALNKYSNTELGRRLYDRIHNHLKSIVKTNRTEAQVAFMKEVEKLITSVDYADSFTKYCLDCMEMLDKTSGNVMAVQTPHEVEDNEEDVFEAYLNKTVNHIFGLDGLTKITRYKRMIIIDSKSYVTEIEKVSKFFEVLFNTAKYHNKIDNCKSVNICIVPREIAAKYFYSNLDVLIASDFHYAIAFHLAKAAFVENAQSNHNESENGNGPYSEETKYCWSSSLHMNRQDLQNINLKTLVVSFDKLWECGVKLGGEIRFEDEFKQNKGIGDVQADINTHVEKIAKRMISIQIDKLNNSPSPDSIPTVIDFAKYNINYLSPQTYPKNSFPAIINSELINLQLHCYHSLLGDQLESGAWAKSYYWRKITDGQSIPCVGTYSGTLLAVEALMALGINCNNLPNIQRLRKGLDIFCNKDGRYFRSMRTASFGKESEPENERHTAAAFLIKVLINQNKIYEKDRMTIEFLTEAISTKRIKNMEYMDVALISKALLVYYNITKEDNALNGIKLIWEYLINYIDNTDDFNLMWMQKEKVSVESAIIQWYTIWSLLPLLEAAVVFDKSRCLRFLEKQKQFVISTYKLRNENLLPLGFRSDVVIKPLGKSLYATSLAIITSLFLQKMLNDSGEELVGIINDLVHGLSEIDEKKLADLSVNYDPNNPTFLSAFQDYAAILLATNFILSPMVIPQQIVGSSEICQKIDVEYYKLGLKFDESDYFGSTL